MPGAWARAFPARLGAADDPGAMILVIDNYDSFTYNLVQYVGELGERAVVARNDAVTVAQALALLPARLIVSPGPRTPDEAGVTLDLVRALSGRIPILGVCLGHQAIARAFGGRVVRARRVVHGKTSAVHHDGLALYAGLPSPFSAMRYHSLVVDEATLPGCLAVTARSTDGEIMGLRHRDLCVEGVQFHPESIGTEHGKALLGNFLRGS
jgi:anthranilate synthase/aminodeoxychorismate synthase-like glutamine amidotransferase